MDLISIINTKSMVKFVFQDTSMHLLEKKMKNYVR